jgi:hypothetical protein
MSNTNSVSRLIERAESLDHEAALARLIALIEDPLDGIAVASDLVVAPSCVQEGGIRPFAPLSGDFPHPYLDPPASVVVTGHRKTRAKV